mgnify:FL=1
MDKILIVDDEHGIVFMVEKIYKKRDFIVFGANDGAKAVEIFEKERPNLVFIDIHMPYSPFDGIETLKRIKQIDKNANCVMLTRIYDNMSISQTKELGAMHYITKPFQTEDLDRCISEIQSKLRAEGGEND